MVHLVDGQSAALLSLLSVNCREMRPHSDCGEPEEEEDQVGGGGAGGGLREAMALSVAWDSFEDALAPASRLLVTLSDGTAVLAIIRWSARAGIPSYSSPSSGADGVSVEWSMRWRAHAHEVWTGAFVPEPDAHHGTGPLSVLLTGGDDSCLCRWHVTPAQEAAAAADGSDSDAAGTSTNSDGRVFRVSLDRRSHGAGVTAIWQCRTDRDLFATGVRCYLSTYHTVSYRTGTEQHCAAVPAPHTALLNPPPPPPPPLSLLCRSSLSCSHTTAVFGCSLMPPRDGHWLKWASEVASGACVIIRSIRASGWWQQCGPVLMFCSGIQIQRSGRRPPCTRSTQRRV